MSIKTLGSSNNTEEERAKDDYYATHPKDVRAFLAALKRDNVALSHKIWECAAGEKHISNVLEEAGHYVLSTDLIVRAPGVLQHDFISPLFMSPEVRKELDHPKRFNGDIITNPPYAIFNEFYRAALNRIHSGSKLFFLLPVRYLEGKQRYTDIFYQHPPRYIYQYVYRMRIGKNGDFDTTLGNAVSYCWIVFEKGFTGDTVFRWIEEER